MYRLKIKRITGSILGTREEEILLEYTWDNLEIIKENAIRIKEHYDFFIKMSYDTSITYDEMCKEYGNERWFRKSDPVENRQNSYYVLNFIVLLDTLGNELIISVNKWADVYERLLSIGIVQELSNFKVGIGENNV